MPAVVSPADDDDPARQRRGRDAVVVLVGVVAAAVPLRELDEVGARGQRADVVAAVGVGDQAVDVLPAALPVGAVGAHVDVETGALGVGDRPGDVAGEGEHGVDARGRPTGGHLDHGGRSGRCHVVEVLRGVDAGLVGELDEVAARGKAADVVAAVLAGQRPAVVVAIVVGIDGGVDADLHVREADGVSRS